MLEVFQGFVLQGTADYWTGTSSIIDVCTIGTCTLAYVLLTLPVFRVLGPSVLLAIILLVVQVFRTPLLQYCQYPKYEKHSILRVEYQVYSEHLCNVSSTETKMTFELVLMCVSTS